MRKIGYGFLLMLVCCSLVIGCAPKAYKPVDVNQDLQSGKYVQKVDNFIVLFDKSGSMVTPEAATVSAPDDLDVSDMGPEKRRISAATDVLTRMIMTIPDIKLNSGLRIFWGEETALVYGMTPFNDRKAYLKSLAANRSGIGRTPMGRTIAAAGEDLKPLPDSSAMIIISDFDKIEGVDDIRPASVMANIAKVKEQYGDKLCIYTIRVGNAPNSLELAQEIAKDGKCGFAVSASELATPAAMASFVERVFYKLPPPPVEKEAVRAAEPTVEAAVAPAPAAVAAAVELEDIHFDFDKSNIKPNDRAVLDKHADWLMKNKNYTLLIEGNCDERGTVEYNMALGQRRAAEAKKYLVNLGVEEARIKTISYGKERPLDPAHTEEAWAKNRRDHFVLNAGN
ncbi:MAG: peptidoglycan-associated lipoprotein Pal [Syntrophales bacterium]